jgi:hypothetical protein
MCTLSLLEASLIFEKLLGWRIISAYIRKKPRYAVRHAESFPAFTHMGLISAAFNLDRSLG